MSEIPPVLYTCARGEETGFQGIAVPFDQKPSAIQIAVVCAAVLDCEEGRIRANGPKRGPCPEGCSFKALCRERSMTY